MRNERKGRAKAQAGIGTARKSAGSAATPGASPTTSHTPSSEEHLKPKDDLGQGHDPAKALARQPDALPEAHEQAGPRIHLDLPGDPVERNRVIKDLYVHVAGGHVLRQQYRSLVAWQRDDDNSAAARLFVEGVMESVKPRDAIEEMLLVQMTWTHARLANLSRLAVDQTGTNNVRVVHEACDRAASTFRRQMLALAEYRRPPRTDAFTVVKQLNAAQQQLVNNAQAENPTKPVASNELGSSPAKALPPHADGIADFAPIGTAPQAVAMEHRPQNQGRESPQ